MVRRKMDFTMEARPFLRTLMEKTGETVHLAILDHDSILYIITHESKQRCAWARRWERACPCIPRRWERPPRVPAREEIERIIARGLPMSAPNTIVDPKALRRELATVRARNYAVDDEETRSDCAPSRRRYASTRATWSRRSASPAGAPHAEEGAARLGARAGRGGRRGFAAARLAARSRGRLAQAGLRGASRGSEPEPLPDRRGQARLVHRVEVQSGAPPERRRRKAR